MADLPVHPDTGDEPAKGPDHGSTTGPPRWVTAIGVVIAIVMILLFFGLHLTGVIGPGAH